MSFLKSFFGSGQQTSLARSKNIMDVVTSTAALVSNPAQIDPILDKVRAVSSQAESDAELSAADEIVLLGVYAQLEEYLATNEPIRSFTKEELRARLSPEMQQRIIAYENGKK